MLGLQLSGLIALTHLIFTALRSLLAWSELTQPALDYARLPSIGWGGYALQVLSAEAVAEQAHAQAS